MSKSSRIAALDEKIEGLHAHLASLAAEHDGEIAMLRAHCGIPRPDAPPADPAPVQLTADDSYNGEVNIQYPPTPEPLGPLSDESKAKLRAHEAARKASATLAVGDTVETLDRARLADNTICAASPAPGAVGTVEAITTAVDGKPYKVRFSTGSPDYWYYPASSLRRVQPAPDVQPAAGYVVSCMRHGTRNCPDCFGIAAPAARVPSPTCGTCHGRWNHCPDCTPAEQPCAKCNGSRQVYRSGGSGEAAWSTQGPCPDCMPAEQPAPDLRREIEAALGRDIAMPVGEILRLRRAIRAAAAVPPVARPGDERDDELRRQGYNIGIEAVQRKMLAELKGDTHEQR